MNSASARYHAYVIAVVAAGSVCLGLSIWQLAVAPPPAEWLLLAALTLLTGSFTVKIPGIPSTISASETFVVLTVLLFGYQAATVTVAVEAFIISVRLLSRRDWSRVVFNMMSAAFSIFVAGSVLHGIAAEAVHEAPFSIGPVLAPLALFTAIYFLLNSATIATAIALQRGAPPLSIWIRHYRVLSINYFGSSSVALLLMPYIGTVTLSALGLIIPLLLISYLTYRTSMGRVEDANKHVAQVNSLYLSTVQTLAMAIDAKDQITHGHVQRVQAYAVGLAKALGVSDSGQLRGIEAAALLHDTGKLAVPEHILNKPGALTTAEFAKMKLHASVGADILSSIAFPYPVIPIVRHHHENWDGTGYPAGIAGTDIPLGARILSVVDCFDALTSDRPYRPRLTNERAFAVLRERRGSMYDPLVVDAFLKVFESISVPDQVIENAGIAELAKAAQEKYSAIQTDALLRITATAEESNSERQLWLQVGVATSLQEQVTALGMYLRRTTPATMLSIFCHDDQEGELVAVSGTGEGASTIIGARIPFGQRMTGWVAANRSTTLNSDPALDFGDTARHMVPRYHSCLSTPLVSHDDLRGVLNLYSTLQDAFSAEHRRIVESVATRLASMLFLAVANQEMDTGAVAPRAPTPLAPAGVLAIACCRVVSEGTVPDTVQVLRNCADAAGVTAFVWSERDHTYVAFSATGEPEATAGIANLKHHVDHWIAENQKGLVGVWFGHAISATHNQTPTNLSSAARSDLQPVWPREHTTASMPSTTVH